MSVSNNDANSNTLPAVEFLKALFGHTEASIFLQTLANNPDDPAESPNRRHLMSRDIAAIERFIAKHDHARRGLFVCVATITEGARTRSKDTAREIVCFHQDLDFKGIAETEAEIWAAIERLEAQPSIIIRSGGGLHLYWLLREPLDAQEHREVVDQNLRGLAEIVAGDPATCEISRLMRLPGTGNSKYGDIRPVTIERLDPDLTYEMEGLVEWISYQRPVLTRKTIKEETQPKTRVSSTETKPELENPFLAAAAAMGRKPRLDVTEALAAMAEGNIHDTQVRVSAALLGRGEDVEDVVAILMEATRQAIGADGYSWNWRAEEKRIRTACAGALKKFPPPPREKPEPEPEPVSQETENVADLGLERAKRQPKPNPRRGKVNHLDIGEILLAGLEDQGQALMFTEKGAWRYEAGLWRLEDDRSLRGWLDARIEQCIRGTEAKSQIRLVNETRAWIIRHPDLQAGEVAFDAHGMVPTRSGLVDPVTGEIFGPNPAHYCTWQVPFEYRGDAKCPFWLQMLDDVFADREAGEVRATTIQLIQEVLGAAMLDRRDKALSKAIIFQGGSNYGKSGMIDVMAGLFGPDINTTPLDTMDSNAHALMPFLRRVPWVLHEAFDQSKWHLSSSVKAIISGDAVQINIKGGRIFDHKSQPPIFWGSNSPPQFREATEAITNRVLVVECRRKFFEDKPVGAALEAHRRGYSRPSDMVLALEMEGVLAWAMEGLRRVKARGHFVMPAESRAASEAIRMDSNLVAGFIDDCIEFDPDMRVGTSDFCAAFAVWWTENKGENRGVPSNDSIGKALAAYGDNRIAVHRKELKSDGRRYYAGIRLNENGLRYWNTAIESNNFTGKTASTSANVSEVNTAIPSAWDDKNTVIAMRRAHAENERALGQGTSAVPKSATGHIKEVPSQVPSQAPDEQVVDELDETEFKGT